MDIDILILVAFCFFIVLVGIRLKQLRIENQTQATSTLRSNYRKVFKYLQCLVLLGLAVYMIPLLWADFQQFPSMKGFEFFLRCLIFLITIYVLIIKIQSFFKSRNS